LVSALKFAFPRNRRLKGYHWEEVIESGLEAAAPLRGARIADCENYRLFPVEPCDDRIRRTLAVPPGTADRTPKSLIDCFAGEPDGII